MKLSKKYGAWALVTGASAGIGQAYVRFLASQGVNCVVVARRLDRLLELKAQSEETHNVEIRCVAVDLTAPDFLEKIKEATDDIDISILINNAGFGTSGYFVDIPADVEATMVRLNCLAPVILTHHFLPKMTGQKKRKRRKKREKGAVIFVSSIGAIQPTPGSATYAATKVFNQYLGEAIAFESKKHGIDVLTVLPGTTTTEFQEVSNFKLDKPGRQPADVVRTTFKHLGRDRTVIDGLKNRINSFLMKLFPTWLKLSIAHSYMRQRSTVMEG